MDLISILFSFGFDVVLSGIIAFPLVIFGMVLMVKAIGRKTFNQTAFKKTFRGEARLYLITGILLFIALILFPSVFTFRGKLDAVTWILMIFPGFMFLYWIFDSGFRNLFSGKLKKMLWGVLTVGLLGSFLVFYGVVIEANTIVVKEVSIDVKKEHEQALKNKKIVLVSDIHMGPLKQEFFLKKVVKKLNSVAESESKTKNKLFLLIPGDFIAGKFEEADMLYPLTGLSEAYETYAIIGNHDFNLTSEQSQAKIKPDVRTRLGSDPQEQLLIAAEVERVLTETGITVIRNDAVNLGNEADKVVLLGVDDIWSETSDVEQALTSVTEEDYTILLAHNPDVVIDVGADENDAKLVDLVVAGHTHGGEIRFPAIPGISEKGFPLFPLPTALGQKYDKGYFAYEGEYATIPLYITSGVGVTGTKARLFNPPEIVLITFN